MKKIVLSIVFFCVVFLAFGQKKDKVLVTIDGVPVFVSEFKRVYEKNLHIIESKESKSVKNNLRLFINYKLKVAQAYNLKLDTLRSYRREMETYKNELIAPYLRDKQFLEKLVEEVYFRTKNEVNAKHILIRLSKNYTPKDTLVAYNKIVEARKRILAGATFESVAKQVSEDPSAKRNGGDLGYFSAFKMVYPFEDAAYKTKVGETSKPFKTRFGYHIVQTKGIRLSKGEIQVAHILITGDAQVGKKKIDSVYQKLKKGVAFKDLAKRYSNDKGSKAKGGVLAKFGAGRMVKPFENVAFSLKKVTDFSKPFKTRFGWHIVKLIKKYPVQSFDKMKDEIALKVKKSGRGKLSDNAVLNKLKKQYKVVLNKDSYKIFKRKNFRAIPTDSLQNTLLTINNKKIKQIDFVKYTRNRRHKSIPILLEMFTDREVLSYYKENLIHTEPAFAHTLKEYEDGLLLFELMQQKIWNKASNDTLGLQNYYSKNKKVYQFKEFKTVKGSVMNDYQTFLEKEWIAELRNKSIIKVKKKQLKKLIKFYEKKK